jgi:hypothetical protein
MAQPNRDATPRNNNNRRARDGRGNATGFDVTVARHTKSDEAATRGARNGDATRVGVWGCGGVAQKRQRCGPTYRKKTGGQKSECGGGAKNRKDKLESKTTINHRSARAAPDRRTYQGFLFGQRRASRKEVRTKDDEAASERRCRCVWLLVWLRGARHVVGWDHFQNLQWRLFVAVGCRCCSPG